MSEFSKFSNTSEIALIFRCSAFVNLQDASQNISHVRLAISDEGTRTLRESRVVQAVLPVVFLKCNTIYVIK